LQLKGLLIILTYVGDVYYRYDARQRKEVATMRRAVQRQARDEVRGNMTTSARTNKVLNQVNAPKHKKRHMNNQAAKRATKKKKRVDKKKEDAQVHKKLHQDRLSCVTIEEYIKAKGFELRNHSKR
jgi:hypothetical protein